MYIISYRRSHHCKIKLCSGFSCLTGCGALLQTHHTLTQARTADQCQRIARAQTRYNATQRNATQHNIQAKQLTSNVIK
jgi:hypothetical protein